MWQLRRPWHHLVGSTRTNSEIPQKHGYSHRISAVRESQENARSEVSAVLVTNCYPIYWHFVKLMCKIAEIFHRFIKSDSGLYNQFSTLHVLIPFNDYVTCNKPSYSPHLSTLQC